MKTAFDAFKNSTCYHCGYCKERKLSAENVGMLDVRRNGVVKIWCYAANDVVSIMTGAIRAECPYYSAAENE